LEWKGRAPTQVLHERNKKEKTQTHLTALVVGERRIEEKGKDAEKVSLSQKNHRNRKRGKEGLKPGKPLKIKRVWQHNMKQGLWKKPLIKKSSNVPLNSSSRNSSKTVFFNGKPPGNPGGKTSHNKKQNLKGSITGYHRGRLPQEQKKNGKDF